MVVAKGRAERPDDFAALYSHEEIDQARAAELLPSEAAAEGATADRLERIGAGQTILVDWMDNKPLEPVSLGVFADRVMGFLAAHKEEPSAVNFWADRNRFALREFWARSPGDALELKGHIEKATADIVESDDGEA